MRIWFHTKRAKSPIPVSTDPTDDPLKLCHLAVVVSVEVVAEIVGDVVEGNESVVVVVFVLGVDGQFLIEVHVQGDALQGLEQLVPAVRGRPSGGRNKHLVFFTQ